MKYISKKIVFMLAPFLFLDVMYAGTGIDMYLNTTYHDNTIEIKKDLFETYKYKRNYIEKLRAKVELSHFEDSETEYSIQAFPKSVAQIDIEENIYNIKKSYELKQLSDYKMLKVRYNIVLSALYQKNLGEHIQKQIKLYKDKLHVANATLTKSSDVERLVKIKNKLSHLKMESFKRKQKYTMLLHIIQSDLNTSKNIEKEFDENWVLSVDEIRKNVETMSLDTAYKPKEEDLYKVQLLEQKLALEKVKDRWSIRNFTVEYDDSKRKGNAFSVGMSLEIPLSGTSNNKHLDNHLKLLKARDKVLNREQTVKREVVGLKDEITYLYDYIQQINGSYINIQKYVSFSKMDGVDAQFLLDLKKENLQYEIEKIRAKHAMRKAYIALLAVSGKIEHPNGQNFLSSAK